MLSQGRDGSCQWRVDHCQRKLKHWKWTGVGKLTPSCVYDALRERITYTSTTMAQKELSGLLYYQLLILGISLIFKDPSKNPQRGLDQLCEQHLPLSLPPSLRK
jgi:hypothetical protein